MRMIAAALLAAAMTATSAAAEDRIYLPDPEHTEVRFYWDHAGVSEQSGEWGRVEGTVHFDVDNIEATTLSITIDPASVNTGVGSIDRFMTGPEMFDVRNFPLITFTSTGAERTGETTARVAGKLTIKGRTQPIVLDVTLVHHGPHPVARFLRAYEGDWLGVHATGTLHRSLFDLGYGYPIVSDTIRLEISAELKAQ